MRIYAIFALVEARRIELLSENRSIRSSTSVVCRLDSRECTPTNRLTRAVARYATAASERRQQTFTVS